MSWSIEERLRFGAVAARARLVGQPPGDFRAAGCQRAAQQLDHPLPRAFAATGLDQSGDLLGKLAPVDDGALVGDAAGGHSRVIAVSQCGE